MSTLIQLTKSHSILSIILNNPLKMNALNEKLILELTKTLKLVVRDKSIRLVCIRGSNNYFCAGADLKEMQNATRFSHKQNLKKAERLSILFETLYDLNKPTVAIVNGGAFGGALGLLACCDIVIAEKSAQFGFLESRVGLVPAIISPYIIKAIGERHAKRYFLTAEKFSATTAKSIGLVHEVCDKKSLDKTADKFIQQLLKESPNALTMIKKCFEPISPKIRKNTIHLLADIITSEDAREGIDAFFEKRPPKWSL